MSDRRHTPRPSLPEGYQYGDAAATRCDRPFPPNVFDGMRSCTWREAFELTVEALRTQRTGEETI